MWCNTHALPLNLICFQAHVLYLPQAHTFLQNDSESDLEKALIEHIEDFLLELERGFMFLGSQQRISIAGMNYYVDMVLYN